MGVENEETRHYIFSHTIMIPYQARGFDSKIEQIIMRNVNVCRKQKAIKQHIILLTRMVEQRKNNDGL